MDRFGCGVSLNTTRFIGLWRGFRLVAGVGIFPADRYRWHRGAHLGGTAAPGIVLGSSLITNINLVGYTAWRTFVENMKIAGKDIVIRQVD